MELGSDRFSLGEVPSMSVGNELDCECVLGFDRCAYSLSLTDTGFLTLICIRVFMYVQVYVHVCVCACAGRG